AIRLEPAFGWRIDEPGDRGRDPTDCPSAEDQEHVVRGVLPPPCDHNSQADGPDHEATHAVCPVAAVPRHAIPPVPRATTLPVSVVRRFPCSCGGSAPPGRAAGTEAARSDDTVGDLSTFITQIGRA